MARALVVAETACGASSTRNSGSLRSRLAAALAALIVRMPLVARAVEEAIFWRTILFWVLVVWCVRGCCEGETERAQRLSPRCTSVRLCARLIVDGAAMRCGGVVLPHGWQEGVRGLAGRKGTSASLGQAAAFARATLHRFAGTFSGATTVYVPRPVMAPLNRCVGVPSLPNSSLGRSRRFVSKKPPEASGIDVL